ncbi:MAG: bifunctional UDP-sugar hydrolase/5'-nucleotidase, partial [Mobilitalea sp.]
MKKIMKLYVLLGLLMSIIVWQNSSVNVAFAKEEEKYVTILFTHDMHDNMLPVQTIVDGEAVYLGGYARLKTAIDIEKEKTPAALLVDGGDFSMGTPFQTIYESEAPQLRILGLMGYEAVTLGNHEFDYRAQGLTGSLKAALNSGEELPLILQSNVVFPADKSGNLTESLSALKQAIEDYGVKDYTVFDKDGVKIGVFGVMGEESESMAPMSEVTFSDEIEQAKRVVKILKEEEKVDFILCLSHSGTKEDTDESEDEILAKEVPEINVIISGHSHTLLKEPIIVGNTLIASVEDYGKYLGVIKMSQDVKGTWVLDSYEPVKIDESFMENEAVAAKVTEFKELVQTEYFDQYDIKYDEIVAYSDYQFLTPNEIYEIHDETTIGNLITDAYRYAVKRAEGEDYVPIAATIVPQGTIRATIFKGNITAADAFCISSLGIGADKTPGYPLISIYLSGEELKASCEVDASITPIMGEAQLFISGINFTFNPNRLIFNKVTETALVNEDGTETAIEDDKLYRVVCGLYSAQMLSVVGEKSYGLLSVVPKDADGEVITDFEKYIISETVDGTSKEIKEWYAISQYLQSFDQVDGVPQVPAYYSELQGRKITEDDSNIVALVRNPNRISFIVYT